MTSNDLTITFSVDKSPEETFNAINNVRGWWSVGIEGNTSKPNDEFTYRYQDLHFSRQKLTELIPNQKVVWLVTESHLSFLQNKSEWTETRISFELSRQGDKTQVKFTHWGLTPKSECFNACSTGWNQYVRHSLQQLISTGKGQPDGITESSTQNI